MYRRHLMTAAAFALPALAAAVAQAHDFRIGEIAIGHPYARSTAAGQAAGGGYLKLDNRGAAADRLLSASAPGGVAASTELHAMTMDGNVMRMRRLDAIDLPAGRTVELKPGGLHLMFLGLKAPLKPGDRFPLTLRFERAGDVVVEVHVEAPKAPADAHTH